MFTGIIEEIGKMTQIQKGTHSAILQIQAKIVLEQLKIGDSVAVNGVCLTVTSISSHSFTADVMHETLNRSALSALTCGSSVNLERAMPANGRFDGHIVAGHVDGTGTITSMTKDDNAIWIQIKTDTSVLKYIVEKGSITIDGISLTVASVDEKGFAVSVIPHTGAHTTLLEKKPGATVNLETDMIGKYVEKLLGFQKQEEEKTSSNITMEFLSSHGF